MDAQGAASARPYVEKAGATFTTLLDEENILGQVFGFKAIPNGLLIDESGVLPYHKFGRFDTRNPQYAQIMETWATTPPADEQPFPQAQEPIGGPEHQKAIQHFQRGTALYRQGKVQETLAEWRKGRDLEPDNYVIRRQIWAVEHPERFYKGSVDYAWQKEQMKKGE